MDEPGTFLSGVVEGFYGRCWSYDTRCRYADYLQAAGLNTYIYCPKSDPYLRKRWPEDWPKNNWEELCQLSDIYKRRGIFWGVGLSPFELYRDYRNPQKDQLKRKVDRLSELSPSLMAVLFDDMPGNVYSLAARQAEIVGDILHWLPNTRILMCPTYYSRDLVLQKHFGQMPENYWPELGRALPPGVDVFWTGNQVCSTSIEVADIQSISAQIGRKVILWDNYPVNDGATRSQFLYLEKLSARPQALQSLLTGHLCNPMNQGLLSLPALSGLSALYGGNLLEESMLSDVLGPSTWKCLTRDQSEFERVGLCGMSWSRRMQLAKEYDALPGPAAMEVSAWLRGEYRFDPACLTD